LESSGGDGGEGSGVSNMEMKDVVTSVLNIIGPAFLEQVRGGERFESYVNR